MYFFYFGGGHPSLGEGGVGKLNAPAGGLFFFAYFFLLAAAGWWRKKFGGEKEAARADNV